MTVIFNFGVEDKNFYYLSGIEEKCSGVFVFSDEPKVFVSPLEAGIAEKYATTVVLNGKDSLWKLLKAELKGQDEIALNFPKASIALQKKLKKIGIKKFKDVSEILNKKRSFKTLNEVKKLRRASEIASKSIIQLRDFLKPGLTELEIKAELEYLSIKNGAEGFSFDTIVASGPNASIPHAMPTNRVVRNGDPIVIDFGPVYRLYTSDMTRTFLLGKNLEFDKNYRAVRRGQTAAIDVLEGGVRGKFVTDETKKHTGKMIHSLGHGVGLDTHEAPNFSNNLMNTMVFTIEPGIYEGPGVRIEDVVHLDGRADVLTTAPKDLDFAKI